MIQALEELAHIFGGSHVAINDLYRSRQLVDQVRQAVTDHEAAVRRHVDSEEGQRRRANSLQARCSELELLIHEYSRPGLPRRLRRHLKARMRRWAGDE